MKNIKKGCSPQRLQHLRNICPCYILFYANLLKISICKIKKRSGTNFTNCKGYGYETASLLRRVYSLPEMIITHFKNICKGKGYLRHTRNNYK